MSLKNESNIKNIFLVVILICMISILSYVIYLGIKSGEPKEYPKVTLNLSNKEKIVIELYPEKAPNTVSNFINLVNSGYYNHKIFYGKDINTIHVGRTKTGDEDVPKKHLVDSTITENSKEDIPYNIDGEFLENGYPNNDLKHSKYMLSLARGNYTQISKSLTQESYNSGGGLFNIVMGDEATFLDGKYAVFGKVIEGQKVLDDMFKSETIVKDNKENKYDLKPFKKQVEIISATTDYKKFKEVKVHKAFNLDEFLTEAIKKQIGEK